MYRFPKFIKSRSAVNWGIQRPAKSCSPAVNLFHSLQCQPQPGRYLVRFPWPATLSCSGPVADAKRLIHPDASLPLLPRTAIHDKTGAFRLMERTFLCPLGFLFCVSSQTNSLLISLPLTLFWSGFVFIPNFTKQFGRLWIWKIWPITLCQLL